MTSRMTADGTLVTLASLNMRDGADLCLSHLSPAVSHTDLRAHVKQTNALNLPNLELRKNRSAVARLT